MIDLRSNAGPIRLHLPPHFGATVHVTLTYTDDQSARFHIIQNLGLVRSPAPRHWNYLRGTPRKSLRATGKIGNGANRILISTIDGDITIPRTRSAVPRGRPPISTLEVMREIDREPHRIEPIRPAAPSAMQGTGTPTTAVRGPGAAGYRPGQHRHGRSP